MESDGLSGQMRIIVTKNGDTIGSIPAKPSPFAQTIRNVTHGYYEVRLNTGRVLWQADLKEEDLLWSAAFPEDSLDVDENGTAESATDGHIILRFLFGLRGSALTDGVLGQGAQRTDPALLATYLEDRRLSMLDADCSGDTSPMTDGNLIIRFLTVNARLRNPSCRVWGLMWNAFP